MKKKKGIIAAVTVVLLVSVLAWYQADKYSQSANRSLREPAAKIVATEAVIRGSIYQWISAEGTARATRREFLAFEQPGKVVFIAKDKDGSRIREGSHVRGPLSGEHLGQLLARVDRRDHQQAINQLEAELASARQNIKSARAAVREAETDRELALKHFQRSEILHTKGAYADSAFEQDKGALDKAKASLTAVRAELDSSRSQINAILARMNQAKVALERTAIFAPFSGVIGYLNIHPGDLVSPQTIDSSSEEQRLATTPIVLIDPSEFEVTLHLPVYDGMLVQPGQSALLMLPFDFAESGNRQKARVHSVTPAITPGSRTIQVKLRTTEPPHDLLDGMYVKTRIAVASRDNTLLIPNNSLTYLDNIPYVLVVENNGRLSRRRLVLGIEGNVQAEVIEGLHEGEQVVTQGGQGLTHGDLVIIRKSRGGGDSGR